MKKVRIGLLTLPLSDNYGGIIQIAALNKYLKEEGYLPVFLNKKFQISKFKQFIRYLFKINPFYNIYDLNNHAKKRRYLKNLNSFIKRELKNSTKPLYTPTELKNAVKELKLDVVIAGSDQIWRSLYTRDNYKDYFFGFLEDFSHIKKIIYAASFGIDKWENEDQVSEIKTYLNEIDAISVREDTGVRLCNDVFVISNVEHVLDPTFLVDQSYYESIINREYNLGKSVGLFSYVLDKSGYKRRIIEKISNKLNLEINSIYLENDYSKFKSDKLLKPSIGEWLYHFKEAKFVITDSFHGMIFSIIFNKQFLVLGNKERGVTRFTSLLKLLNLSNRLIMDVDNSDDIVKKEINYNIVNKRLREYKLFSQEFLKRNL